VNVLVPRDPAIRITGQKRDYSQSLYELDFAQSGLQTDSPVAAVLTRGDRSGQWSSSQLRGSPDSGLRDRTVKSGTGSV
jgi:hypothetical protein